MRPLALAVASGLLAFPTLAAPDAEYTYQGRLSESGLPANGTYPMVFRLYDAPVGGSLVSPAVSLPGVAVADGVFSEDLTFDITAFNDQVWLEVVVNGATLSPRTKITGAPFAHSLRGVYRDSDGNFSINSTVANAAWHVENSEGSAIYGYSPVLGSGILGGSNSVVSAGVEGFNASSGGYGLLGRSTNTAGAGRGVQGSSAALFGIGVFGEVSNASGQGHGVYGRTFSTASYSSGVFGIADASSGIVYGGQFTTDSSTDGTAAVFAQAPSTSGETIGVYGYTRSPESSAVAGFIAANSGGKAISGANGNANGWAGHFIGRGHFSGHTTIGRANVRTTGAELFGVHTSAGGEQFGGMYVTGDHPDSFPFYGYSSEATGADAYHYYDGRFDVWRLVCGGERLTVQGSNGYIGMGDPTPTYPLDMASGARCSVGGIWTNASSREFKHDFEQIDRKAILRTLVALPITEWSYKTEDGVRHLGPIAEEFASAFGLGDDDKAIGTVDANGVALAAIQGLHEVIEDKDRQIQDLNGRLEALELLVEKLVEEKGQAGGS